MSPGPSAAPQKPVTRADIEAKLAEIRGVTDDTAEVAESAAKTGIVVAAVGVLVLAFLLGRRRGRKKSTIIEVRRI
jgi:MYXO-CTERM domain-containing protein